MSDTLDRLDALVSWTVANDSQFRQVWPAVIDVLRAAKMVNQYPSGIAAEVNLRDALAALEKAVAP